MDNQEKNEPWRGLNVLLAMAEGDPAERIKKFLESAGCLVTFVHEDRAAWLESMKPGYLIFVIDMKIVSGILLPTMRRREVPMILFIDPAARSLPAEDNTTFRFLPDQAKKIEEKAKEILQEIFSGGHQPINIDQ